MPFCTPLNLLEAISQGGVVQVAGIKSGLYRDAAILPVREDQAVSGLNNTMRSVR